jgi:site-specific recombinase XerD
LRGFSFSALDLGRVFFIFSFAKFAQRGIFKIPVQKMPRYHFGTTRRAGKSTLFTGKSKMATTYSIQQRHKAKGIMTWYLRTCSGGKQKFESLHTTKKGEALQILQSIKLKAAMPEMPGLADKDIGSMIRDWLRQVEVVIGGDGKTYMAYHSRIKKWGEWCAENAVRTHADFTSQMAYNFVQDLAGRLAPKTVHEIVKIVKKCREWNIDTFDLRQFDPFKSVKTPKLKKGRVEFWTSEEVERILALAPTPAYRAFWGLMAYAGLRFSEARNLKACDARGGLIRVVNGKGGKSAELPVSAKLAELIKPYLNVKGLLIPEADVPLRSDKAINCLKIAVGIARIPGEVSHHKLRHSFASELLRKSVNPKTVQELMRHSSIDTLFDHYAHVLRSDLAEAVEKI